MAMSSLPPVLLTGKRNTTFIGGLHNMFVRSMLIASAAVILSTAASAGPIVYAISTNYNTFTGVFGTMDLTAGTFNQIGPSTSDPLTGLVPGPNGSLDRKSV